MVENAPRGKDNEPASRQEVHSRSLAAANRLLDGMLAEPRASRSEMQEFQLTSAMEILAGLDAKKNGARVYTTWGKRMEAIGELRGATRLYVKAAHAGDAEAGGLVRDLLDAERTVDVEDPDVDDALLGIMHAVIQGCAEGNIPADNWIQAYSQDAQDAAQLKIKYHFSQRLAIQEGKISEENSIGKQYLDNVTEQFLASDDFPSDFALDIAPTLWTGHSDPEKKDQIFRRVTEKVASESLTFDKFRSCLYLCRVMLRDKDVTIPDEYGEWMLDLVYGGKELFAISGDDPFTIHSEVAALRIQLAQYEDVDPDALMGLVDDIARQQLNMDIPDAAAGEDFMRSREQVTEERDAYLHEIALKYAEAGKFVPAKHFLDSMANPAMRQEAEREVTSKANSPQDIEIFAPDSFTLLVDPGLGETYEERRLLAQGNPDKLKALALRRVDEFDQDAGGINFAKHNTVDECISVVEKVDAVEGNALRKAVLQKLVAARETAVDIDRYGRESYMHGDEEALPIVLENVERFETPFSRLLAYAELANITAPESNPAATAELGITSPEVAVYVEPTAELPGDPEPPLGQSGTIADREDKRPDDPGGPHKGRSK